MKLDIETNPIALRSAFVAPTFAGSVAGVCPQNAFRRVSAPTQVDDLAVGGAGTAMGHRSWSPLIT
jgi:hypothetical protein